MKRFILLIAVLSICSIAYAGNLTVRSKYVDLTPNNGFLDAGTYSNPLIIQDDHGNAVGELKPKYIDLTPNNGFMDAGSTANPMEIEIY